MSGFPLLLIPLAICNIIIFLMPGVAFDTRLFALTLPSLALWTVTLSDAMIALGLLLLMLEMLRSARAGGKYIIDHLLALVIFAGAAVEFALLPPFANATFFLLTLIALVDFLSGLGLRRRPRRVVETVVAEPVPQPVVVREPPPAPAPAAVIVPPPPPPEPMPLPKPVAEDHTSVAPARVEPVIDVVPNETQDRPARPNP